jgi:hypothetical protein
MLERGQLEFENQRRSGHRISKLTGVPEFEKASALSGPPPPPGALSPLFGEANQRFSYKHPVLGLDQRAVRPWARGGSRSTRSRAAPAPRRGPEPRGGRLCGSARRVCRAWRALCRPRTRRPSIRRSSMACVGCSTRATLEVGWAKRCDRSYLRIKSRMVATFDPRSNVPQPGHLIPTATWPSRCPKPDTPLGHHLRCRRPRSRRTASHSQLAVHRRTRPSGRSDRPLRRRWCRQRAASRRLLQSFAGSLMAIASQRLSPISLASMRFFVLDLC